MKAVLLQGAGGVESLQMAEIEKSKINETEVLIEVKSISINPVDVKARAYTGVLDWIFGKERPIILGWDVSGQVVEKGASVRDFDIGDEVFGMVNFFGNGKAYAEYVASPESHLALKPKKTSYQAAAASTMAACTAYQILVDLAEIKAGDRVLIHAASGGVGHFAVQIAKHFGAYVIGTSSSKNRDFVLALGADEHIDYRDTDFLESLKDVDIVIDTIQGDTLFKSVLVVRNNGIIVTLPSPEVPSAVQELAREKQVNIEFLMVSSKKATITAIAELLKKGIIKPHIYREFSFNEIAQAHLEVETNRVVGKVIVNL